VTYSGEKRAYFGTREKIFFFSAGIFLGMKFFLGIERERGVPITTPT
jgi:hypothetical protein